jgi:hypothetical protein
MNFKHIAIAATLAVSSLSSFAGDIDLGAGAVVTTPGTTLADFLTAVPLDASLPLGDTHAANNAIIVQDDTAGGTLEQIAVIDQVGTLGGLAAILQQGNTNNANVAYIFQVGTTNARVIITQR